MAEFKSKFNPFATQLQLVPTNIVLSFKAGVATQNDLPLTGNAKGDARIANDTGKLYVWNIEASSGLLTDWVEAGDIMDIDWSVITNKPSSVVADIDDAVTKKHTQNTDNRIIKSDTAIEIEGESGGDGVIRFIEDNSEVMRISGGNVGIGTTTPLKRLHIADGTWRNQFRVERTGDAGGMVTWEFEDSDNNIFILGALTEGGQSRFTIRADNNEDLDLLTILDTGNVGIGVANPGELLHIKNFIANSTPRIKLENDAQGYFLQVNGGDNDKFQILETTGFNTFLSFQPTSLDLTLGVNGVVTILDTGNVGIGTATPGGELEIKGTSHTNLIINSPSNAYVSNLMFQENGVVRWVFSSRHDADAGVADRLEFSDLYQTPKMTILQNGNVGIGTTSPATLLHVENSIAPSILRLSQSWTQNATYDIGSIEFYNSIGSRLMSSIKATYTDNGYSSRLRFFTLINGVLEEILNIVNGNVGIGTASPTEKLDVNGNIKLSGSILADYSTRIKVQDTFIEIIGESGGDGIITFVEDNVEVMRITGGKLRFSNFYINQNTVDVITSIASGAVVNTLYLKEGKVGIGTASPAAQLQIQSTPASDKPNIAFGAATATSGVESAALTFLGVNIYHAGFGFVPNSTTANSKLHLAFGTNGDPASNTTRVTFQANGNVGIGTNTPQSILDVAGDIYPTDDDSYYLGRNSITTPKAYKGVILKDQVNGNYYRIELLSGVITATQIV